MTSKMKEEALKLALAMRQARRVERREAWVKAKPQPSAAEQFVNRMMEMIGAPAPTTKGIQPHE